MKPSSSLIPLFTVAQALGLATGFALDRRATCSSNNCLRAVRASGYGHASVAIRSADCQSFFDFTKTPATSTSTSTITTVATFTPLTVTLTNTVGETDITTPPTQTATYTSTVTNTLTPSTVTITATTTATALTTSATSTDLTTTTPIFTTIPAEIFTTSIITFTTEVSITTVTVTTTDYNIPSSPGKRAIEARQTIRAPSLVPSYASACSGIAHYSSACSCIGVTPVTATVASPISVVYTTLTNTYTTAAPVTTITITSTTDIATIAPTVTSNTIETDAVTVATPTSVVTTIETDTITLPAPTATITITITSTTVEPTPSTTIFSSVAASSVSTTFTTVTVYATAVVAPFSIEIDSGSGQTCNGQFVNTPASNNQYGSESSCGAATEFNIDQFGYLHYETSDIIAIQQTVGGFEDFRFLPFSDVGPDFQPCTCSITGTHLSCNCYYGSLFFISFDEIQVGGSAAGTAFTPIVVPV